MLYARSVFLSSIASILCQISRLATVLPDPSQWFQVSGSWSHAEVSSEYEDDDECSGSECSAAGNALDGKFTFDSKGNLKPKFLQWKHGSCTHTNPGSPGWWRVNLGGDYEIYKVMVWNRQQDSDGYYADRLAGTTISISDKVPCLNQRVLHWPLSFAP